MLFCHSSSGLQIAFWEFLSSLSLRWRGTAFVLVRKYLLKSTEIGFWYNCFISKCGLSRSRAQCSQRNEYNRKSMPLGQEARMIWKLPAPRKDVRRRSKQLCWVTYFPCIHPVYSCSVYSMWQDPAFQPTSHCSVKQKPQTLYQIQCCYLAPNWKLPHY